MPHLYIFYPLFSNNMLYPKEDKENKVLMYAVSTLSLYALESCNFCSLLHRVCVHSVAIVTTSNMQTATAYMSTKLCTK